MYKGTEESDKKLEELWIELGNISIDDEDCIMQDFYQFETGTYRMAIWHWFDEQHSKGIASLLYPNKSIEDKVYVLTYSTDGGYDRIETDVIGVYTTKELAEVAMKERMLFYSRASIDDFYIEQYVLNVNN